MKPIEALHVRALRHLGRIGRWCALVCGAGLGLSGVALSQTVTGVPADGLVGGWPVSSPLPGGGWRIDPSGDNGMRFNRAVTVDPGSGAVTVREAGAPANEFRRLLELEGGKVKISDPFKIPGRAGELPLERVVRVSSGNAARVLMACIRHPVCAAAAIGGAIYLGQRYRSRPGEGSDDVEHDEGQSQQEVSARWCWIDESDRHQGGTDSAACDKAARSYSARNGGDTTFWAGSQGCYVTVNFSQQVIDGARWLMRRERQSVGLNNQGSTSCKGDFTAGVGVFRTEAGTATQCPPVVDFSDPAYSVPGGPPGVDGKCPTGRYEGRMTAQQFGDFVEQHPSNDPAADKKMVPLLEQSIRVFNAPGQVTLRGPAEQTGQPSSRTTTGPDGSTTTTSETPKYSYRYDGDTITYQTTNITTTTNNEGDTTTVIDNPAAPGQQDPKDPCTQNPGRVGCMELGSPPDDQVTKRSTELTWSEEVLGLPATCPAPRQIQAEGRTITVSYGLMCEAAELASPWVKAGGALAALFIVLAALRSS